MCDVLVTGSSKEARHEVLKLVEAAGLTGWALVLSISYGLLLGGIILVLQALLQPGQEPFRP
jgi:hypothetical protein